MSSFYHNPHLPPRRTHRKRFSVSKLSSETVQTLPEYSSPPRWPNPVQSALLEGEEFDKPPDYPSAIDEGDADTEEDQVFSCVSQHIAASSKRRSPSHHRRRKRLVVPPPPAESFLDTLLERSVHALELSNALLQSSMSTQTSLSALLSPVETEPDRTLEVRARNLSTRIRVNSGVHATWIDHLDEISKGVDKLLENNSPTNDDSAVSRSLPTSTVPQLRHRRKPSLLELNGSSSGSSQLQYSHPERDKLIAPAPRALTQYVESTADPRLIILPSTLGLRASDSSHSTNLRSHLSERHSQASVPQPSMSTSDDRTDNTSPAFDLLSNLAQRTETSSEASSRLFGSPVRRGSTGTVSTERASTKASPSCVRSICSSPADRSSSRMPGSTAPPRSPTPKRRSSSTERPLTPSPKELPTSSSDSTSSTDHSTCYRTMQSLRKILDKQPSSTSVNDDRRKWRGHTRAPSFHPLTPPPGPVSATSTATASVSRLLTKGRHSLSTRPPSPPMHSSLKVRSVTPTPAPSPSTLSLPDLFGNGVAKALGSGPSSSASTPKRISFAELPESYSSTRPGGSKLRQKKSKKKTKERHSKKGEEGAGWFKTWIIDGLTAAPSNGGRWQEDRIEERMARGWGSRPGYGTVDDWAV